MILCPQAHPFLLGSQVCHCFLAVQPTRLSPCYLRQGRRSPRDHLRDRRRKARILCRNKEQTVPIEVVMRAADKFCFCSEQKQKGVYLCLLDSLHSQVLLWVQAILGFQVDLWWNLHMVKLALMRGRQPKTASKRCFLWISHSVNMKLNCAR